MVVLYLISVGFGMYVKSEVRMLSDVEVSQVSVIVAHHIYQRGVHIAKLVVNHLREFTRL